MRLAHRRRVLSEAPTASGTSQRRSPRPGDRRRLRVPPPTRPGRLLAQIGEPPRVVHALTAGDLSGRPGRTGCQLRQRARQSPRRARARRHRPARIELLDLARHEPAERDTPGRRRHRDRPDDHEQGEQAAVLVLVRSRRAVLHEGRPRERPAGDDKSRSAGDRPASASARRSLESANQSTSAAAAPTCPARDCVRSSATTAT